jgi:hypothetical protein
MLLTFLAGCAIGLAVLAVGHVATKAIAILAYQQANTD